MSLNVINKHASHVNVAHNPDAIANEPMTQLVKRVTTLLDCLADFGFGRGHVLLMLLETNFLEYAKTVLARAAQEMKGTDAEECLWVLRRDILPAIIGSILPSANPVRSPDSSSLFGEPFEGLWEQLLEQAYVASTSQKS